MNTDKNTALYEKMATEQDKFRDWLKSQSPAEVLNHAYEYTVREDIVMAMEELELPEAQAAALLASPSPLADVYKEFADRETSYMDVIRDSIEEQAEAALNAQRELPLYRHDAAYAREQGDLDCTGRPAAPTLPARRPLRMPLPKTTGTTGWAGTPYPR